MSTHKENSIESGVNLSYCRDMISGDRMAAMIQPTALRVLSSERTMTAALAIAATSKLYSFI